MKFRRNLNVLCGPSHASGLVGRTAAFVAIDEFGHMKNSEAGPDGANYLFKYLSASTMTMDTFGKVLALSSPVYVGDPITSKIEEAKSGKLPLSVWYKEPTWVMNPYESEEKLRAFCSDEGVFLRDFAAEPGYVDYTNMKEKLFANQDINLSLEMENILHDDNHCDEHIRYLGLDPAIKGDQFGIALSRVDDLTGNVIVDGVTTFNERLKDENGDVIKSKKGELLDAEAVNNYVYGDLFDRYPNIVASSTDIYMYAELLQRISERVYQFDVRHVLRKEYEDFKGSLDFGKVSVAYHDKLYKELRDLELINDKRVDHPKMGSKDIADAVVQAYTLANENMAPRRRRMTVSKAYTIKR
ncbi:hypothetical protein HNP86_001930 [Methanococcus maripaludis]|uniref:Uncharacterized protein n=1 Tax=Methanococcus maripaludis TaxID=39152 RepID=A0A7J9NWU3_METMI|nr:hypothetical protein [Methanococcus maripaludis]